MAKKEAKTNKKENNKNKKSFLKDFKAELKKVVWPTPKQLVNNTIAVVTIVLITAAIVFVLDFAFESMNKYGIDKVKSLIDNTSASENVTTEDVQVDENAATEETVEGQEQSTENQVDTENNAQ